MSAIAHKKAELNVAVAPAHTHHSRHDNNKCVNKWQKYTSVSKKFLHPETHAHTLTQREQEK